MNLLLDIGHPAHVHLFRNLIHRVQHEGGNVIAATRDKDVTVDLCRLYGISQRVLSRAYDGTVLSGVRELALRTVKLLGMAVRYKPDALLGTSLSIGIIGRLIGRPSFVFSEDDAAIVPLFAKVAYPLSTYIVTPRSLSHENYGEKHLTYPGYHELAYLHPDHFTPDPNVPISLGLSLDEPYFILRFVSLKAHHDTGAKGLPHEVARRLVSMLSKKGRVLITSEGSLQEEFRKYQFPLTPEKLHDVLAFASMYIGDSQTVTIEASMLGVPSIRCNTFVGRITCMEELEHTYGLTRGFLPGQGEELAVTVEEWLQDLNGLKREYRQRRDAMLARCVNLADWLWKTLNERLQQHA